MNQHPLYKAATGRFDRDVEQDFMEWVFSRPRADRVADWVLELPGVPALRRAGALLDFCVRAGWLADDFADLVCRIATLAGSKTLVDGKGTDSLSDRWGLSDRALFFAPSRLQDRWWEIQRFGPLMRGENPAAR